MVDLAVQFGTVDPSVAEQVTLSGRHGPERDLVVLLPHLAYHQPIEMPGKGS